MKKTGYIMIAAGFLLSLRAAGGCEIESMSPAEVIITVLTGTALMIAGDVLKGKKRSARQSRSATTNQYHNTPNDDICQGGI